MQVHAVGDEVCGVAHNGAAVLRRPEHLLPVLHLLQRRADGLALGLRSGRGETGTPWHSLCRCGVETRGSDASYRVRPFAALGVTKCCFQANRWTPWDAGWPCLSEATYGGKAHQGNNGGCCCRHPLRVALQHARERRARGGALVGACRLIRQAVNVRQVLLAVNKRDRGHCKPTLRPRLHDAWAVGGAAPRRSMCTGFARVHTSAAGASCGHSTTAESASICVGIFVASGSHGSRAANVGEGRQHRGRQIAETKRARTCSTANWATSTLATSDARIPRCSHPDRAARAPAAGKSRKSVARSARCVATRTGRARAAKTRRAGSNDTADARACACVRRACRAACREVTTAANN